MGASRDYRHHAAQCPQSGALSGQSGTLVVPNRVASLLSKLFTFAERDACDSLQLEGARNVQRTEMGHESGR